MLLFLPIKTDIPVRRRPYVNHALIALNVLAFCATDIIGGSGSFGGGFGEQTKSQLGLLAGKPEIYQFVTYQFLHGDVLHLAGNMLFLWVFGNSINVKMGNMAYLFFYLAGGVFAALGFATNNEQLLIGASGSIAAVTTAYLVLYPRSEITMFYWFWFYIGTWHLQALYVICLKIILWDNILAPNIGGGGSVAYSAHLAGYFFGFLVSLIMLLLRALPRDQYDILALWKRAHQRSQMKSAMADPNAQAQAKFGRVARPVSSEDGKPLPLAKPVEDEPPDELAAPRREISEHLRNRDYTQAAERYLALVEEHPDLRIPAVQLMDIANQLATLQRHEQAAAAYERYLEQYPGKQEANQVRLMLGIIYSRYLEQYEPARKHLEASLTRLTNASQREQATQWLDKVRSALDMGPSTA